MRALTTIQTIDTLSPIPDADKIVVASLVGMGWQIVVGKDEFVEGDKVVFFEIDAAIPSTDERFDFLKDRCLRKWMRGQEIMDMAYRIKTIKLRGVVSQGLVMPLSKFPELSEFVDGDDVTTFLGVRHFDEITDYWNSVCGKASAPNTKGTFPSSWVPKTDETRIQSIMKLFTMYSEMEFEATDKDDGSSLTALYAPKIREEDPFFLCSRNNELKFSEDSSWWLPIIDLKVREKMYEFYERTGRQIALQGEIVGPGYNKNRDQLKEIHWRIFKIWDIDDQKFLLPQERYDICKEFELEHVKVLKFGWKVFEDLDTLEKMLVFVEGKTDNGFEKEGVVFKSMSDSTISFKCINNKYLLKEKDDENI